MTVDKRTWWKDGTVYQIWPASYKDSNGDGIGDIQGIISSLDYLKELGVDILWISPWYKSPQYDMGYDISDYEAIHEPYGNLDDADQLIRECHARGMRIILDLVVNHTSHQHSWFQESRSSKDNPKRDWYMWRPAKYDKDGNRMPPNNWRAIFGGSAWEWDEPTQEYYLHLFAVEQPDLNWENKTLREAVYQSAMTFWLERGVDGFRVDTVNMYSKDLSFPDAPITIEGSKLQPAFEFYCNGPRMHEWLREMNQVLSKYDAMTVGELPHTPDPDHVLRYVGARERQLSMVFQFDMCSLDHGVPNKFQTKEYDLRELKTAVTRWQQFIEGNDGWTTVFIENHDQARSISRYGSDKLEFREISGKMLAIMMTTMTGTLFLYQGEEIGMVNLPEDWSIDEYRDLDSLNYYNMIKEETNGHHASLSEALKGIQQIARDHARSPVQWDDSAHGGFTTGKPWMRTHDNYPEINVKKQRGDPHSLLSFWKGMLAMRKQYMDLFVHGRFKPYDVENPSTFTYSKEFNSQKALVVLNFSDKAQAFQVPKELGGKVKLLVGNVPSQQTNQLTPYEGRVYLVE